MTPSEVSSRLADRVHDVVRHLLPNGKREGHEWRVGSVSGEKGSSMGVHLTGDKAGIWCDFASGETGDLLDLWCAVNRCEMGKALSEAKEYLGVREPVLKRPSEKTFTRPDRPKCVAPKVDSPVMEYLKGRGLTEATIKAFKVAEQGRLMVFPYLRNDSLVHWKTIGIDRDANGKKTGIKTSPGTEPCLFGWHTIPSTAREVTIVEGEIDAMTAWQYGKPALSVPFGGGGGNKQAWIEYEFDNLQRFDTIWLALDQDEEGRKATEELVKRLGRERCRLVELPAKDFNECLDALFLDAEDIAECYEKAKSLDPEKLVGVMEFRDQIIDEFFDKNPTMTGMATPWEKQRDLIRFRESELTVWTGWSGHGKSQLLNYIAFHGMRNGAKFCIASMEMPAKRTMQRMVRQAAGLAHPSRGYIDAILQSLSGKLWIFDQMGSAKTSEMIETFKYAARRYGVNHFIVDSLAKLGMAEDDYNGQKQAMEALVGFAHEMGVHVHLVAHPRKADDESKIPGKLDVRGGAILTDLADNVITVWRNKAKETCRKAGGTDYDSYADVKMIVSKQRLTGEEDEINLWFDVASAQYLDRDGHKPRQWVNYTGIRGDKTEGDAA
ncbi:MULTISPECIES: toprim domain-containing protein [Pseudomonas]|uniref:Twinkle protein n=1 Tax=Pseudomonas lutea TaxID=243924 RepID=A0A9X8MHV5_9PSED|nr:MULTISPECIES: toprim domain-containing protein [Pseudomonas]SER51834.1 twinkle protein [Pseudomonas lutea]